MQIAYNLVMLVLAMSYQANQMILD